MLIFFHSLVLQEYLALTESSIPVEPVLGGMRELLYFLLVLMNRLNKTESAVFKYCSFSLLLKDPFFKMYLSSMDGFSNLLQTNETNSEKIKNANSKGLH